MRDEWAEVRQQVVLSRTLKTLLEASLDRGEQGIVLMNRRGFANRLVCVSCKTRITCPNCNVGLVMQTSTGQSICHYCRKRTPTLKICPNPTCGAELVPVGSGTQRVEDVLSLFFPKATIARVDSDTMKHRRDYERTIKDFAARKIDIIVGTQMIAKGLDFPFVSFVGVVQADDAAMSSDFRAHERMFQLITQVAGRAGRSEAPGAVVVQTTAPDMPALTFALNHDYVGFAQAELEARQSVGLPPFRRVARVVLAHDREEFARRETEALTTRIRNIITTSELPYAEVVGPNPCALARLRGQYRYDLLVYTHTATDLRRLLAQLQSSGALTTKATTCIVDVDAVSYA
jgi:primosomal protein N' (replication factor Y)